MSTLFSVPGLRLVEIVNEERDRYEPHNTCCIFLSVSSPLLSIVIIINIIIAIIIIIVINTELYVIEKP